MGFLILNIMVILVLSELMVNPVVHMRKKMSNQTSSEKALIILARPDFYSSVDFFFFSFVCSVIKL